MNNALLVIDPTDGTSRMIETIVGDELADLRVVLTANPSEATHQAIGVALPVVVISEFFPDDDAWQHLISKLRAASVPTLIFSGEDDAPAVAKRLGLPFLAKPTGPAKLVAAVRQAIASAKR